MAFLTIKLAGYFVKHTQVRGFVEHPQPKNFEMANN